MAVRQGAPEEVVILQPEPVGSSRRPSGPAKVEMGEAAFATRMDVELDAGQGLAPLARAAETLLRQGKRHIIVDLGAFAKLKGEELKALVETRERCARAHGSLVLCGIQKDVAQAMKTLELDKTLEAASDEKAALEAVRSRIESRRAREARVGDLELDIHVLPFGKKKGDESFVEGYRRKGPEGVSRELVVLELDEKGTAKVGEKVRQLAEKKLTAFILDLSQVPSLDGAAVKEIIRAKKLAEERGGYLSLAGAKEAVAGLLKVMNLEKEIPSHASREKAIDDFKDFILDQIEGAESKFTPKQKAAAGSKAKKTAERKTAEPAPVETTEEKRGKTAMIAAPNFDEDEEKDQKRGKTAMIAAPNFDEDEEKDQKRGKTAMIAAPNFDEDEEKDQKRGKTAMIAAPNFDEEPESKKEAPAPKAAPAPAAGAPKPPEIRMAKTEAMPGLTREEALKLAQAAIAPAIPESPKPEPAKPGGKTAEMKAAKTEMMPGLTKEEALKLAQAATAPAKPEPPKPEPARPAAPGKTDDVKVAKTEVMPGLTKEEALKLAQAATARAAAPVAPKREDIQAKKTEVLATPAAPPPKAAPPSKTGEMKVAKTEAMPGLTKEEAIKLAQAAAAPAPAPPPRREDVQAKKTEVLATPPAKLEPAAARTGDMKVAKTEILSGLSKEEAVKLAQGAAAAPSAPPPAAPKREDVQAKKTEVLAAPPASPATAKPEVRGTGEMKVAKTEVLPGLTKDEATKLAKDAAKPAAAARTGEMAAAPVPKAGSKMGPDLQVARTEMLSGLTREEAKAQLTADRAGDVQVAKTQHLEGMTRDEAARQTAEAPAKLPGDVAADMKKSSLPLFAGAAAIILVAAVLIFKGLDWFSSKKAVTPEGKPSVTSAGEPGQPTAPTGAATGRKPSQPAVAGGAGADEAKKVDEAAAAIAEAAFQAIEIEEAPPSDR